MGVYPVTLECRLAVAARVPRRLPGRRHPRPSGATLRYNRRLAEDKALAPYAGRTVVVLVGGMIPLSHALSTGAADQIVQALQRVVGDGPIRCSLDSC